MAISGGDGSIILTTNVDQSGLKKGMQQANKFAQMSTNEQRRKAQSLSNVYRQQGMSQSAAQKKAWHDLKNNTVATKDLAKATEDVAKKTEQATKETKEYGNTAKRSGTIAKKAFLTVGKAFLTIGVASASAIVAMTKQAVSAYADYEQLVGGVETLFKGSAQKVIDYANDAFYTAGVSANEYMQTAIGVSASLIQSLGGDTAKAADIANMAIIDMSDNVNKLGTDMERVKMAYAGIARQQYVLLDNLALGYQGSKTEMERLLKDAQALTGVKYDINNLADVYSAIHAIQEELGVTGTTAKEAEKTISGSAKMMKAAWQNVLSAIAGGGDLDKAINNLLYSFEKFAKNITPIISTAIKGMVRAIKNVLPILVQNLISSVIKATPDLIIAIYELIKGVFQGIIEGFKDLFSGGTSDKTSAIEKQTSNITSNVEDWKDTQKELNKELKKSLASFDELNTLSTVDSVGEEIRNVNVSVTSSIGENQKDETEVKNFVDNIVEYVNKNFNLDHIDESIENTKTKFEELGAASDDMLERLKPSSEKLWTDVLKDSIGQLIEEIIPNFIDKISGIFETITGYFEGYKEEIGLFCDFIVAIITGIWKFLRPIIAEGTDVLGNSLKYIISIIFDVIASLGSLLSFFKNIFSGNFKEAGKDFVNFLISGLNSLIDGINIFWTGFLSVVDGIVNGIGSVAEWLGLGGWEVDLSTKMEIPKIPKLAQGAVIPPNCEFMAILGDNKRENEIVSPVSTMKQAVAEVLAQANIGGSFNGRIEVPVIIDGREIARAVREAENNMGSQTVFGGFANVY